MEEKGVWRTVRGKRVFIKEGQSLTDAMKESGKFKNLSDEAMEKVNKVEDLKDGLKDKLDKLNYEELNELLEKTEDFDAKEVIMDKMQEKDVVRYGREVLGLEMKDIDVSGTFDDAVKYVNEANKDKDFQEAKLYHGTNAKFEKFNYDHFGTRDSGDFGQGIYLTPNKDTAAIYGKDIKEVVARYKNPLVLNSRSDYENHASYFGDKYGEAKSLYSSKQVAIAIMKQGYDAVIDNNYGQVVIYDLDNLKIEK